MTIGLSKLPRKWMALDTNVRLVLVYTLLNNAAESIYARQNISEFVYLLPDGDSQHVGFVAGLKGLLIMSVSFFMGWLGDRSSHGRVAKVAALLGCLTFVLAVAAYWSGSLPVVYVFMSVAGMYTAAYGPSTGAIFANSVDMHVRRTALDADASRLPDQDLPDPEHAAAPTADDDDELEGVSTPSAGRDVAGAVPPASQARSRLYAMKHALTQGGQGLGPAVSIALFAGLGDHWTIENLRGVGMAGVFLGVVALVALAMMTDSRHAVPAPPAAERLGTGPKCVAEPLSDDEVEDAAKARSVELKDLSGSRGCGQGAGGKGADADVAAACGDDELDDEDAAGAGPPRSRLQSVRAFCWINFVPAMLVASDVTFALGAGMTIRFFPLFFMDGGMSPIEVATLYLVSKIATVIVISGARRMSDSVGRVAAMLFCRSAGTTLLFIIAIPQVPVRAAAAIFVFRTALMNATKPLSESLMMDRVDKNIRARWLALESINKLSWAGSAALGGLIVAHGSFHLNFLVTACVFVVGSAVLVVLITVAGRDGELREETVMVCSLRSCYRRLCPSRHSASGRRNWQYRKLRLSDAFDDADTQ